MFSGIGCQRMALRNIGADFESWRTCEWDINAINQYKSIHCHDDNTDYSESKSKEELIKFFVLKGISANGKTPLTEEQLIKKSEKWLRQIYNNCIATKNMINVSNVNGCDLGIVDADRYCYIMTTSFPCTDLSIAGSMSGMEEGSGTTSSLLWENKRILTELFESDPTDLPQIILMENVTAIHSDKNISQFMKWIDFLRNIGYSNFWEDMNAKDYGVAQSRDRTFVVSILDPNHELTFDFPKPIKLTKDLFDYLDEHVGEEFYIEKQCARDLVRNLIDDGTIVTEQRERERERVDCNTKFHRRWRLNVLSKSDIHFVGNYSPTASRANPNQGRLYTADGVCPALTTMQGGDRQPHVIV